MRKYDSRISGVTLPGTILAMLLTVPAIMFLANTMQTAAERSQARIAAEQLVEVAQASREYIQANAAALQATSTPTVATIVTGSTIQASGTLPASWSGVNVWGQQYILYVLEPNAGELEGILVTSGGRSGAADAEFAGVIVPFAAQEAGSAGGFVPNAAIPGNITTTLEGTGGGWTYNTTAVTNYVDPGTGHLASKVSFGDGAAAEDFLYRVAVPGQPQLNQMQTNLDMNGFAVSNLESIEIESQAVASMACNAADEGKLYYNQADGYYVCRNGNLENLQDTGNSKQIKMMHVANADELVAKETCPTGTALEVFTTPVMVGEGAISEPLHRIHSYIVDAGVDWQVKLRILTQNGWSSPAADGRAIVIQSCN